MPFIDATNTEIGQSLPPYGPHTITTHFPGYKTLVALREGDMSVLARVKSIYPRFTPFGLAGQLVGAIGKQIGLPEGFTSVAYFSPETWQQEEYHATSHHRKELRLSPEDFKYHVVEIDGIRLYVVSCHMTKLAGAKFVWTHRGLGFSTRLAEALLPKVGSLKNIGEFPGPAADGVPPPTYLPEGASHKLLRERVAGYLNRATIQDYPTPVTPDDITLYQTGMAAIVRIHEAIVKIRPGTVAVFGSIFHSTWHFLEENSHGFKHYGKSSDADLDAFEAYLEGGGSCSYVFTEFPSNPILVSLNLARLRKLADRYGFYVVADDTVAGFASTDLLSVADVVMSSLTKAFSGYSDVMAGSIALNPNINNNGSYTTLKATVDSQFHNEFFVADADQLLSNSEDYLERTVVLNRNAAAMAGFFHAKMQDPKYPISKVFYPPYSPGSEHLKAFLRKPTPELPEPGYGPLLSVEFETMDQTIAFYDNLAFHQGPHLGAHLTLCITFNALVFGKDPKEAAYHAGYGSRQEQVRISAGLEENTEDLLRVCQAALDKMVDVAGSAKRQEVEGKVDGEVLKEEIERAVENDGQVKTGLELA
ncbi:pyridoxal phosphate-dependent transferase [Microdochium trichocladiopsis]|uniref:Pyridoxal phosphate-dependent transferase n=1 Tax=Microdochium trichocladiopsis TaxID=1682393 RepID=A0A9P9BQF5_9PEZI|nr:pyridoxal phosphate-dependent transferase [Microdochium trichocladiopsis]KAH7034828.1 pyridoxal phosphate-dependent transferase [Microdochium trichocladiopsis]